MIEAVKIWNEPNNKSHWDLELDPGWEKFANMAIIAGKAIREVHPTLTRVLGGISPIDPLFIKRMQQLGVLEHVDAVAVHGFPLDWNLWQIDQWPAKLREMQSLVPLPVWVTEVGVSTFGAEEVQEWGLRRTAELLLGRAPRIHWYSLYDLPRAWPATTRHREAEGSAYYRHFAMGLLREDGTPKRAAIKIIAEPIRFATISPMPGTRPRIGSRPIRIEVPGMVNRRSRRSASIRAIRSACCACASRDRSVKTPDPEAARCEPPNHCSPELLFPMP